jgi:NADH-quinone oxidoreductase subunit E
MRHVADQIRCTKAEVEDVVSYYTMFYTKPVGKYVLNVCRTLSCALRGAERVTEELRATLGIQPGQTDPTGTFTLMEVECLGACDRAPVVMVNDEWHECLAPERVGQFVDDLRTKGVAALTGCHLDVEGR